MDGKIADRRTSSDGTEDAELAAKFRDVERIGMDEFREKVIASKTDDLVMFYSSDEVEHR